MNNVMWLVVILVALAAYFLQRDPVLPDRPLIYGESRFTFQAGSREIELVAIGERFEDEDCQQFKDLVFQNIDAVCTSENICVESKYQCKQELDAKYMDMFDRQPSRTHYMHLERQSDHLKGVILFWGLTDDESMRACLNVLQKIQSHQNVAAAVQCI